MAVSRAVAEGGPHPRARPKTELDVRPQSPQVADVGRILGGERGDSGAELIDIDAVVEVKPLREAGDVEALGQRPVEAAPQRIARAIVVAERRGLLPRRLATHLGEMREAGASLQARRAPAAREVEPAGDAVGVGNEIQGDFAPGQECGSLERGVLPERLEIRAQRGGPLRNQLEDQPTPPPS